MGGGGQQSNIKEKTYVLKDSPEELISAAGINPKGRTYNKQYSKQPGGIKIDELVLGMKYASLAITDDEPDTLKKVTKTNPWHEEALTMIMGGSKEDAHKPLTELLASDHLGNLTCDHIINISKYSMACHPLDTQGYIAHNDDVIVLAFRCTTSAMDWMTNLQTTSSEWEVDEDIAQGHSGFISCVDGLCASGENYKPRVHTGFYNNFLATAPLIQEHIAPLLQPDQPPRKLYVVGHSLGAGIATMAACYFLLEFDWLTLPQKLICVTAGSPRACQMSMRDVITERMNTLRPLDKAVICRIVKDKDCVPNMPPSALGFVHLDKLVFITNDGEILINPQKDDNDHVVTQREMKKLTKDNMELQEALSTDNDEEGDEEGGDDDDDNDNTSTEAATKSKYEKKIKLIPTAFKDHMPDFYLKPLVELFENELEAERREAEEAVAAAAAAAAAAEQQQKEEAQREEEMKAEEEAKNKKKTKKLSKLFRRGKKKNSV